MSLYHKVLIAAAALIVAFGVTAADERPMTDLYDLSEAISEGKVDVGDRYDMDDKKGRFHLVHVEALGLDCESCHVAQDYAPDYLLVDRVNAVRKAHGQGKGEKIEVLDRTVCLGCHKTGGLATVWYQTVDQ